MPARTVTSENTQARLLLALAQDTFVGRTVAHSWGTASDGVDVWSFPVGATSQSVSGGTGQLTGAASNTIGFLGSHTLADGESHVHVSSSTNASSLMLVLRATSSNTYYRAGFDGVGQLGIQKVVSGTATDLSIISVSWSANTSYWLYFRVQGSVLMLFVLQEGGSEQGWLLTVFDTEITGAGQFGIRGKPSSTTATISFDSFVIYQSFPAPVSDPLSTRLQLSANHPADLSMRMRAMAVTLPSVPMRLVVQLLTNLLSKDTTSRVALAATQKKESRTRLSFFTARLKDAAARLALMARTGVDTALRFIVSSPTVAEWTNMWARLLLAQAQDTFANRTTTTGWGHASDGQNTWTINGTTTSQVSQGWGQFTGNNAAVTAFLGSHTLADAQVLVLVGGSNNNAVLQAVLRATGTGTYYRAGLDGNDVISIVRTVGGTSTTLTSATYTWDPMIGYWIRFRIEGSSLLLKVWPLGWDEPPGWVLTSVDSAIVGVGQFGIRSKTGSSTDINYFTSLVVTGANPLVVFDDLATFLHLRAIRTMGTMLRMALCASIGLRLPSRLLLAAVQKKETALRFLLSAGTNTFLKAVRARLVLAVLLKMDSGTRMSLLPGRQFVTQLRTSLIALGMQDLMSRMNLVISALKASSGRESSTRVRTAVVQDTFVRPSRTGGWGPSTPDGRAWSFVNPLTLSIVSNSAVMTGMAAGGGDSLALLSLPASASTASAALSTVTLSDDETISSTGLSTANVDVMACVQLSHPGSSTSSADAAGVVARAATSTTYYRAGFLTNGSFAISKVLAGAVTDLVSSAAVNPVPGTPYVIRLRVIGPLLAARFWQQGANEPVSWTLTAFDTDIVDGGHVGLRMKMKTAKSATISALSFVVVDSTPSSSVGNLLARLRMSALSLKGIAMRMNLVAVLASQLKDVKSRLTVYTGHLSHVAERLRVAARISDDLLALCPLQALSLKGLGTRLLYAYSSTWYGPMRMAVAASTSLVSQMRMVLSSLIGGLDTRLRTLLCASQQTDWGARFALFAPPGPPLVVPPLPDPSSLPTGIPRMETTPVALSSRVTYACNGVPLAQQPLSATAPRVQGGAVQAGDSFSILFTRPVVSLLSQVPDGATVSLTFALELGTAMTAPVLLSSLLSPDSTLLTVTATIMTTTVQSTYVVDTQFF